MIHVPIKIDIKSGGEFRVVTRNPEGSIGQDTGWFPNLVTDVGLVNMTTIATWANRFHIGDSNDTPAVTDTALFGWLAESNTGAADVTDNLGANDYQAQMTRVRRFNPGPPRIIREIGVNNNIANTAMSIRALVTPEISQSDVQILDGFYRFTAWPNLIDGTGIVNIFGDDYDYIVRMGEVDQHERPFDNYVPRLNASSGHIAYTGDIGSVTESPTGPITGGATSVEITEQGSGFCNYTVVFGVDDGNDAAGIRSLRSQIMDTNNIYIQVEFRNRGEGTGAFDSTIPKNNTREISFDLGINWNRH